MPPVLLDTGIIVALLDRSERKPRSLRRGDRVPRGPLVRFHAYSGSIASRSGGSVVCLTYTAVLALDQGLCQIGRIEATHPEDVAVGPDDSIYAILRPMVPDIVATDLVAFEATGERRWQIHFPEYGENRVIAGTEGARVPSVPPTTDLLSGTWRHAA